MSSTNKTPNLGLNAWLGTDHPTRTDFVEDNALIDSAVGTHNNNSTIHLTREEKTRISNPITIKQYTGTGDMSLTINFEFTPKLVIIQKKNAAPVTHTSSGVIINFGVVAPAFGGTQGLSLSAGVLTVSYNVTVINGARTNFNEKDANYILFAFR